MASSKFFAIALLEVSLNELKNRKALHYSHEDVSDGVDSEHTVRFKHSRVLRALVYNMQAVCRTSWMLGRHSLVT